VPGRFEGCGGVDVPEVADAPLEDNVVGYAGALRIEAYGEVLGVDKVDLDAALLGCGGYGLLFPADGVV
jgi:hypothetical protein